MTQRHRPHGERLAVRVGHGAVQLQGPGQGLTGRPTAPLLPVHVPHAVQRPGPAPAVARPLVPLQRTLEQLQRLGVAGLLTADRGHAVERHRLALRYVPVLPEAPQGLLEAAVGLLELVLLVGQLPQPGEQPGLALGVPAAAHRRHGGRVRGGPGVEPVVQRGRTGGQRPGEIAGGAGRAVVGAVLPRRQQTGLFGGEPGRGPGQ